MLFDAVGTRLNNTDKTTMLNVVRTILFGITQPETPQTCCKLLQQLAASLWISSLDKSAAQQLAASRLNASILMQVAKIRLAASFFRFLQQVCDNNLHQI